MLKKCVEIQLYWELGLLHLFLTELCLFMYMYILTHKQIHGNLYYLCKLFVLIKNHKINIVVKPVLCDLLPVEH